MYMFTFRHRQLVQLFLVVACLLGCTVTFAGGFQLNEYSSNGLGRSYAGEGAIADTSDVVSRNPAAIMMFNRPALSVGAIYVDPSVNIQSQSVDLNIDNVAPVSWIPNLHVLLPINSRFGVSGSLMSIYGLGTRYNTSYDAGEIAGTTSLMSVNANISGAYRISPHWSVGLGGNVVYGQAKFTRYAGVVTRSMVPAGTTIAHIDGNGSGYGLNAGILWQINDDNRYALSWRSKIVVKFYGDYSSELAPQVNKLGLPLPYATGGQSVRGHLTMNLPETWELSGYNKVAEKWAVHYGVLYTRWSKFQEIRIYSEQGRTLLQRTENFHDAWRGALGATYYLNTNWVLRTGIAFDQSPIPAASRSISIPDQNRIWFSAGASYAFNPAASVDVGVSWMCGQRLHVDDGPYHDLYTHATAWLYGVNFNYVF